MADWSATADSGDRASAMDDLIPCFLADHQLLDLYAGSTTGGVWREDGDAEGADQAATGYPCYRAYDGFAHDSLVTKPNAAAATWYLVFDCSSAPIAFDAMFLKGTNLDGLDDIIVEIADDAAFTDDDQVVLSLDTASDYGLAAGTLGSRNTHCQFNYSGGVWQQFSGVKYLRIKFAVDSGTATPEVSEAWFGVRRQLLDFPEVPWDDAITSSAISAVRTRPGLTTRTKYHMGRARREPSIAIGDSSDLTPVTDWWDDCVYGSRSFVWIEPVSDTVEPIGRLMAYDADNPNFNPRKIGPNERRIAVPMIEINPFYSQD